MLNNLNSERIMTEIFDLITKLRQELEACRTGDNDTKVMDAVQTLNAIDNNLLKQANDDVYSQWSRHRIRIMQKH